MRTIMWELITVVIPVFGMALAFPAGFMVATGVYCRRIPNRPNLDDFLRVATFGAVGRKQTQQMSSGKES